MIIFLSVSIDHLTIPSRCGKGPLRRISEVFDCWFESGSMPYAQVHYPFETKREFEDCFPADFIAEGIDQTRGWYANFFPQVFTLECLLRICRCLGVVANWIGSILTAPNDKWISLFF